MHTRFVILLAGTFAFNVCSGQSAVKQKDNHKGKKEKTANAKIGTASFYANKFNGRRMANGDIFYQSNMTAACNRISLNTYVKVTNLRNKRDVIVKVTDRMHRNNKRLIDLSRAAAHQLGYTGHGLTQVKVEILGKKKPAGWKTSYAGE